MSEEETSSSSSSSSSSGGEETKSNVLSSSSLPEPVDTNAASQVEGDKPTASEKDETKINPSNNNKNNNNNNNNSTKKKRKRKHRSESEDEREILELQRERYDRLIYTARKQLHKTAKQIKTFLLQKEIRKRSNKSNEKEGGENTTAPTGLDAKKSLDLEVITSQAIRQLGLYHCDPRFKMATEETTTEDDFVEVEVSKAEEMNLEKEDSGNNNNNNKRKKGTKKNSKKDDNTPPVIPAPLAPDDPQKTLVDAVLVHKRFSKSLEEWNEKVTEYRRWCMNLEQRNVSNPFGMDDDFVVSKRSKKNKNKKKQGGAAIGMTDGGLQATVENESSLFCTLGGRIPNDSNGPDEFNKYSKYGPGSDPNEGTKRKNRQGQRQRRAKAMAIEAKKRGRSNDYYQSANWREPKPKEDYDDSNHNGTGHRKSRGRGKETDRNQRSEQQQRNQQYDYSSSHEPKQQQQSNQTEEQQHPSWAAKQAQSTGIVAFKGTKITF